MKSRSEIEDLKVSSAFADTHGYRGSAAYIFKEGVQSIFSSLGALRGTLFIYDESWERLEPALWVGVDSNEIFRLQHRDDYSSLLSFLRQVEDIELIEQPSFDGRLQPLSSLWKGLPYGAIVPARAFGISYGVALLGFGELNGTVELRSMLSSSAMQMGLMIENFRLREAVQKAETRYHELFNLTTEFCFILKLDGMILDSNRCVSSTFEISSEESFGKTIYDFLSEHSHEAFRQALRDVAQLKHTGEFEVQFQRKGREPIDAAVHLSEYFDTRFNTRAVYMVGRDITERKKADLQLLRFANAIHFTVNPIEITDVDGRIIYVNPAFERASGYTKDELIGKDPSILNSRKHPREFWQKMWGTILAGKVWTGEVINRRKNGELMYTELLVSPILDASGKVVGFLGSHTDITEKKRLQEQLFRSQKMESIGTLAAGIAHEVGNPLTSISSLVQIVQRTSSDHFVREKLDLVREQINRIAKIIRQLVDFSRPTNYEIKSTDVNALLKEAVNIVRYGKKANHVEFILDLAEDLPLAEVVQDQLIQVFINILINAVDALEGKAGKVRVSTRNLGETIEIAFSDTGRGMPPAVLDKIFEPFFTTKKVGEGTGLGLWVSYGIIQNMHGDISVHSEVGKGSTFTVTIPRHIAEF